MGQRHAENIATIRDAHLVRIFDPNLMLAQKVAQEHGAVASDQLDEVLTAADYDAVIVATPTDTHVELILRFAEVGKAVLCEKPLDLNLDRAKMCLRESAKFRVPIQIAFNRRYDPGHSALASAVHDGYIGKLQLCLLTSRDSAPPPPGYIAHSGGMFFDTTIHDFDMIRFITGEEPVSVTAVGAALFDEQARAHKDVDTHGVILTLASGAICQISGSRRSIYGHDQRIEVVGERGMLISQNQTSHGLERYNAHMTGAREPFIESSRDRYRVAYRMELVDFIERVQRKMSPAVTLEDGYRALLIADAATRSLREGKTVSVER